MASAKYLITNFGDYFYRFQWTLSLRRSNNYHKNIEIDVPINHV